MTKAIDLYDKTRIPADEKLLDQLLEKYFSISYKEFVYKRDRMTGTSNPFNDLLYEKINYYSKNQNDSFNTNDLARLEKEIDIDYEKAGRPFEQNEHDSRKKPLEAADFWLHFKSWKKLGTEKINSNDIAHRFYFGIPNEKLYDFAEVLYSNLKNENIPFYFKTDTIESVHRTDNVVLYTSTQLLDKTLSALEKVKNDRPDLLEQCCEPSILTGKLDDKIGYASEQHNIKTSYTDLMCQLFTASIDKTLANYKPDEPEKLRYQSIIKKYAEAGRDTSSKDVTNRLKLQIIIENNPSFKEALLSNYRQELSNNDIDLDNVCFNKDVRKEVEKNYGNKIVLPNGNAVTKEQYLKSDNILAGITPTTQVTLKNGKVLSGEEFIKGVLERADQFNSFQELLNYYGAKIDRGITNNQNLPPEEQLEAFMEEKEGRQR